MKSTEYPASDPTKPGKVAAPARHAALYMRTSHKGKWAEYQTSALQRWSKATRQAGDSALRVRWYRDEWTGQLKQRPEWDRLMDDVKAGRVRSLVCWRLDRLALSCSELGKFIEMLDAHDVNLICLRDEIDLSTTVGRRVVSVLASVAAFESELRSERVLAGQEAARARGIRWGGSEKGRRIKVTARMEAMVKRLYLQGMKIAPIARQVGLSRPTVYRLLEGVMRKKQPIKRRG